MQHTPLQQHHRNPSLSFIDTDKDEDLVLFQELQRREKAAVNESFDVPVYTGTAIAPFNSTAEDMLSTLEWNTHDYDWLMTPPVTPYPSSPQHAPVGNGFSVGGSVITKSNPEAIVKIGSSRPDPPYRDEPLAQVECESFDIHKPPDPSVALETSTSSVSCKSLSAGTRSSTPSRSTTPISRRTARPSVPSKSSASSACVRSLTPAGRAATPSNDLVGSARPSTPIKRPATPTRVHDSSTTAPGKSFSVNKTSSLSSKSVSSMRPSSPASRAWQSATHLAALLGTPQEPPPNLRTSLTGRPHSNPRGCVALKANAPAVAKGARPQSANVGACNSRRPSSSPLVTRGRVSSDYLNEEISASRNGKLHGSRPQSADMGACNSRWPSSSPLVTRGCVSSDYLNEEISASRNGKLHGAATTSMSGVGSKMPRKSLPFSEEKIPVVVNNQAKMSVKSSPHHAIKSTSLVRESSGFGRNLCKKSLDVALTHMDIRGGTPSGFQSFMSNVPTSSLYSVRSRNTRGSYSGHGNSTSSIASSPMATSSNASSEHGMSIVIDPESSELGDETLSEMGSRASSGSQPDPSMSMSEERKVSCWLLGSPGCMNDTSSDLMQIFDQELASLSGTESPLVSQLEGIIDGDDFVLEPI